MSWPARIRHGAVLGAALLIVLTALVGPGGPDRSRGPCERARRVTAASWREGTLRAAGCRAWLQLRVETSETSETSGAR